MSRRAGDERPGGSGRDAWIAAALAGWFSASARSFPWRAGGPAGGRNPYVVLVSELMLQQTQAARVAERLPGFLARFPTPAALAAAPEQAVLAAWAGLGYYRRARLLHAAARAVVDEHGGSLPADAATLRELPGVGEYTAGAIASIAFGLTEPAVDGNVTRVILRLEGCDLVPTTRAARALVRERATALVRAAAAPGVHTEAMMELGATLCAPRTPRCEACPVAAACVARATGRTATIPVVAPRRAPVDLFAAAVVCRSGDGRWLVEQRASRGLWAGMWQVPTVERLDRPPTADEAARHAGARSARVGVAFVHQTTHRTVRFTVYTGVGGRAGAGRAWRTREEVEALPMGVAQRRVLEGGGGPGDVG